MTFHRNFRTFAIIQIIHDDGYSGWFGTAATDLVAVSPKGYPSTKRYALFENKEIAASFLAINNDTIM